MEKSVAAWISQNSKTLRTLEIEVQTSKESVKWRIMSEGQGFILLIPSDNSANFMVLPKNEESGESLSEIMFTLNERLENLKFSQPGCIERALSLALQAVERHLMPPAEDSDSENDDDDELMDDDYGDYGDDSRDDDTLVSRLALEAKNKCDYALLDTKTDMEDNLLAWCSVSVDAHRHAVSLGIDFRGILFDSRKFSTALGFPFDGSELIIEINLADGEWVASAIGEDFMKFTEIRCYVREPVDVLKRKGDEMVEEDLHCVKENLKKKRSNKDEIVLIMKQDAKKRAEREAQLKTMGVILRTLQRQNFGARVVVPEMIKEFKKGKAWWNGENVFTDMLVYVCRSLRELRQRCVVCKKRITILSPLFFCDAEFCLYQFEEERMGVSLLQELQNTKLARFLIATALEASISARDVFEPFPPFLLKEKEIRKRSGFFSEVMKKKKNGATSDSNNATHCNKDYKVNSNKDMELLKKLIESFPPIEEMQNCSSEIELIFKLGKPWCDPNTSSHSNKSSKEKESGKLTSNSESVSSKEFFKVEKLWDDKQWLPYNLLRFILFTNRLLMRPLPIDVELPVPSYFQFAIIYDGRKEQRFEERKQEHGSIFAFHGSAGSNWYSILRNGLRSLSQTKFMSAGAAHGDGMYFSPLSSVSLPYARPMKMEDGKDMSVLALCEIINVGKYEQKGNILVVPPGLEEDVAIRYLIIWNSCSSSTSAGRNSSPQIKEKKLLGDIDLQDHYRRQKEEHLHDCKTEGLVQRNECTELLEQRRIKAVFV